MACDNAISRASARVQTVVHYRFLRVCWIVSVEVMLPVKDDIKKIKFVQFIQHNRLTTFYVTLYLRVRNYQTRVFQLLPNSVLWINR